MEDSEHGSKKATDDDKEPIPAEHISDDKGNTSNNEDGISEITIQKVNEISDHNDQSSGFKDQKEQISDNVSKEPVPLAQSEGEGEEFEIDEYQDERLMTGNASAVLAQEQSSAAKIVSDFKLRRTMRTIITDFYNNFDHKFPPNHPYVIVKNDSLKARNTVDNIHKKRDVINHEITEETAVRILNQENSVLWENLKR